LSLFLPYLSIFLAKSSLQLNLLSFQLYKIGFWPNKDQWKTGKWDGIFPKTMEILRQELTPAELDAGWAEGTAMTVKEVNQLILSNES
jgi:hypothetical protein